MGLFSWEGLQGLEVDQWVNTLHDCGAEQETSQSANDCHVMPCALGAWLSLFVHHARCEEVGGWNPAGWLAEPASSTERFECASMVNCWHLCTLCKLFNMCFLSIM